VAQALLPAQASLLAQGHLSRWPGDRRSHRSHFGIPLKTKYEANSTPVPAGPPMLLSSQDMEHTADQPSLNTVQQCVVNALAAGATLTDAAEAHGVHRVTVYRWMKTHKQFSSALHRARAEFVLARRDDLHHLSNRALETLLAVLDNPRSSPAVLLRTAMFVLQRPQLPKTGWSMPEPAPDPDAEKLIDSAILEQDYDRLPALCNIEKDDPTEADDPAKAPAEVENYVESAAYGQEPLAEAPVPPSADDTECNQMQHDFENCEDVAPAARQTGLRSCPVPPDVLKARNSRAQYLEILDLLRSVELTPRPTTENEDPEAAGMDPDPCG